MMNFMTFIPNTFLSDPHHSSGSVNHCSLLHLQDVRAVGHLQGTSDFYVLSSAKPHSIKECELALILTLLLTSVWHQSNYATQ